MTGRTDTASRLIPASADAIFAALVDPDALMAWLPPKGMTGQLTGVSVPHSPLPPPAPAP